MPKSDPSPSPIPAPDAGLPNPIQPLAPKPPHLVHVDAKNPNDPDTPDLGQAGSDAGAYARGAEAGKKDAGDGKPHHNETEQSKEFEHGYLDAQKIRSDDKPPK